MGMRTSEQQLEILSKQLEAWQDGLSDPEQYNRSVAQVITDNIILAMIFVEASKTLPLENKAGRMQFFVADKICDALQNIKREDGLIIAEALALEMLRFKTWAVNEEHLHQPQTMLNVTPIAIPLFAFDTTVGAPLQTAQTARFLSCFAQAA